MPNNAIKIDGNQNIVVQDAGHATITIHAADYAGLAQFLKTATTELKQDLLNVLEQHKGQTFTHVKNMVAGSIEAGGNVHIGDDIHIHIRDEAQIPSVSYYDFSNDVFSFDDKAEFLRQSDYDNIVHLLDEHKVVVVVGKQGYGKTFLLRRLYNQLKPTYQAGAFINFKTSIYNAINELRIEITDVRFNDWALQDKAKYIIINKVNNAGKSMLLVFSNVQDIDLEEIELLQLAKGCKIVLSSTTKLEGLANYELKPYNFEQLKMLAQNMASKFSVETAKILEELGNNSFFACLLEKNIHTDDFRKAKSHIDTIIHQIKQSENPQVKLTEAILDINPLSAEEKWLLMQFTVLPLKQYDYDDMALLLVKDEFLLTDFEYEYQAFLSQLEWFEHYRSRCEGNPAAFDKNVLDTHFAILSKPLTDLNKGVNEISKKLEAEKLRTYFAIDKFEQSQVIELFEKVIAGLEKLKELTGYFDEKYGVRPNFLSVDLAKDRTKEMLDFVRSFDCDSDEIPLQLYDKESFIRLCEDYHLIVNKDIALDDVLQQLYNKGWLDYNEGYYSLPPTARDVLTNLFDYRPAYFADLIHSIDLMYFYRDGQHSYINLSWFNGVTDTLNFINHAETLCKSFSDDHFDYTLLALYDKLIVSYNDQLQYAKELEERIRYTRIVEKHENGDTEFKADTYIKLLHAYRINVKYKEALPYGIQAKKIAENLYPQEHRFVAFVYNELGTLLQDLGDYTGAKTLLEKAMRSDEQNFGADHPTKALGYNNLALVLQALGDYAGAKILLEKAMRSNEQNFGADHPKTAGSYSNLALVLKDLGDYAGAKILLEKAMRSNEQNFGADHPSTAVSYFNLAWLYLDLEQPEKAVPLWEKAYTILSKYVGENHPHTQSVAEALKKYKAT